MIKILRDPDVRDIVELLIIFAICVLVFLPGCPPAPKPSPTPNQCRPTRMLRDLDKTIYSGADCYSCEGARGCATEGGQWCCADESCSECEPSPVNFGRKRDGGTG